jgi:hypothetical protein
MKMKKKLQFLLLLFIPLLFLANMANPWTEDAIHSGIYSLKNCKVEKEFINIKLDKVDEIREAEFSVPTLLMRILIKNFRWFLLD